MVDRPSRLVKAAYLVRAPSCRSRHAATSACTPGNVLSSGSRRARGETESGPVRLRPGDRVAHTCDGDRAGAGFSMPAWAAARRTTSQSTFAVMPSPQTWPALLIARKTRPCVRPAACVQSSTAAFTQAGIGTVRMCPPLPTRSAMTQCSSRCWMDSNASPSASPRRSPHPRSRATMAWSRSSRNVVAPTPCTNRRPWST